MTGLDVNSDVLDFARKRSAASVQFVRGDARQLPFQHRAFDHVIAGTGLCFVHDWMHTVAELARVSHNGKVIEHLFESFARPLGICHA